MNKFLAILILLLSLNLSAFSADMRFVQVDNLYFSELKTEQVQNIFDDINRQKDVSFVVFSGNNISKPNQKSLEKLVKLTKNIQVPCYFVLGNKDVNIQKGLGKKEYYTYLRKKLKSHKKILSPNYTFEKNGIIFITLDGSKEVIPSAMGYYKADVLAWLDEQLSLHKDKKVVILQHFPIIPPAKKESKYTYKAEEYLKVLEKHNNVKAIFCGHFNVNNEQKIGDIIQVSTQDAPNYRIIDILDYDSENPIFWSTIK